MKMVLIIYSGPDPRLVTDLLDRTEPVATPPSSAAGAPAPPGGARGPGPGPATRR